MESTERQELRRAREEVDYYKDLHEHDQQRREQEDRKEEAARKQRQAERQAAMCYAEDWADAFCKGLARARRESKDEQREAELYPNAPPTMFFTNWLAQIEAAQKMYNDEMRELQPRLAELRKAAHERIAARVEVELGESGLADALREDQPGYLVNW